MYHPPPILIAEVFSAMPDHFRRTGVHSAWADANKGGAAIDSFLEGPCVDRDGHLYVTDVPFGRIFQINAQGAWHLIAEYDGWPNGMKITRDGRFLITDYRHGLMQLDIKSGAVTPLLTHRHSEGFRGLNDLYIASSGDIWFTDQGQTGLHDPTGRVYRLRANKNTSTYGPLELMLHNVPSPNGIVLNAQENVAFVAATRGNCIWRGPIMQDGSLSKVGNYFQLYGATGPDGLAMDRAGNLVIAHPGSGSVWLIDHHAEPIARVRGPAGCFPTNIAFARNADGQANQSLFITDSDNGCVLIATLPHPGMTI